MTQNAVEIDHVLYKAKYTFILCAADFHSLSPYLLNVQCSTNIFYPVQLHKLKSAAKFLPLHFVKNICNCALYNRLLGHILHHVLHPAIQ